MPFKFTKILLIFLIICCVYNFLIAQRKERSDNKIWTPYYSFTTGKKIFYTADEISQYTKGSSGGKEKLQIWVLKHNEDDGWRLVLRLSSTYYRIDESGERSDYPEKVVWAYCDFYSDGRFISNISLNKMAFNNLFMPKFFIRLPDDTAIAQSGWGYIDPRLDEHYQYDLNKILSTDSLWVVEIEHQTPLDSIYILTSNSRLYIDKKKRLPVYKKTERVQGYGKYAGTTKTVVNLDSIIDIDTAWAENFSRDLGVYFQTESLYNELLEQAEKRPDKLDSLISQAVLILQENRNRITDTLVQSEIDKLIADFEKDTSYVRKETETNTMFLHQPAAEWKTKDLKGKMHSLKKYKGKVVLLDFWYRDCPWCIRSMPKIKLVAEFYKNQPVVVLGMNIDKDKNNALFVVDKLKLSYPNLIAGNIAKQYGVGSYPTLIIIDQKGIIRDIHIGWSDDLCEKITKSVEVLLKKE